MKNITYLSNVDASLFSKNKNNKFTTLLESDLLTSYLPQGELAIAVKSISFPVNVSNEKQEIVVGIRSSITSEAMICNSQCDKIISVFLIRKWKNDVCSYEVVNPVFFQSSLTLIRNPTFELIDVVNNTPLSYISENNEPTIVEIMVKEKDKNRMKPPFNMLLISSDEKSSKLYQNNNNMNFTIHLNERKDFNTNWILILKSIQLTSRIFNIPNDDYHFTYLEFQQDISIKRKDDQVVLDSTPQRYVNESITKGCYSNTKTLLEQINLQLNNHNIPVIIDLWIRQARIKTDVKKLKEKQEKEIKEEGKVMRYVLVLSKKLSELLGFHEAKTNQNFVIDLLKRDAIISKYHINIFHGLPRSLIVNCDIVKPITVGKKSMKMLRLLHPSSDKIDEHNVLNFAFRQNTIAKIDINWFDHINIYITDVYGNQILAEDNHPTIAHLSFVNI